MLTALGLHPVGPLSDNRRTLGVGVDAQCQVDIRPLVLAAQGGRSDQRGSTDASVGLDGRHQPVARVRELQR